MGYQNPILDTFRLKIEILELTDFDKKLSATKVTLNNKKITPKREKKLKLPQDAQTGILVSVVSKGAGVYVCIIGTSNSGMYYCG